MISWSLLITDNRFSMYILLAIISGYLLGSIPFGFLIAKRKGVDIRRLGSGNIGFTNVLRNCGALSGALTLILDLIKGFLPAFFFLRFGELYGVLAGFSAMLGHLFSLWLKFRGGKGIATGLGVFIALAPWASLIVFLSWVGVIAITKMVSAGSIAGGIVLPLASFIIYGKGSISYLAIVMGAMAILMHRENIKRVISGKEPRLGE